MSGGLMSGGRMSGGRLSGGLKSYDRSMRPTRSLSELWSLVELIGRAQVLKQVYCGPLRECS